jgi:cysteine desulfurase/selenocysteine lyase
VALTKSFRDFFKTDPGLTHLNNAGLSPINIEAEAVVHHWVERYRREGMFCNDAYLAAVAEARERFAHFLDADVGSVAFLQSTAHAVSQVAFQLGLRPDDEVIMWDQEYGSHLYPWQEACRRTGARLVLLESGPDLATPVERLLAAVTPRTRVIAVSWVQFQTGALMDLQPITALARDRGIWTVVDGFQGIGLLPFSFRQSGIDVLVGGSHKWMTAPVGVGYLCIRQERVAALKPHSVGAYTYGTCEDPTDLACTPKVDALRFEAGSKQVLEIVALGASAALLSSCDREAMLSDTLGMAQALADGLRSCGYMIASPNGQQQKTALVNVTPGPHAPLPHLDAMSEALTRAKISFARRGPGIRLAPHAHNRWEDIEHALRVLGRV